MINTNNVYTQLLQGVNDEDLKKIEEKRVSLLNIAANLQKKHKASAKKKTDKAPCKDVYLFSGVTSGM